MLEAPAGQVSRAQGDIHPGGNPHYLFDPRNGAKVGKGIATRLAKLDPGHAADFDKNAAALERAAADLSAKLTAKASGLDAAKRKIVVYHRSWIYLETWLGLSEVGAVEPKPGIPPDPAHVARRSEEPAGVYAWGIAAATKDTARRLIASSDAVDAMALAHLHAFTRPVTEAGMRLARER